MFNLNFYLFIPFPLIYFKYGKVHHFPFGLVFFSVESNRHFLFSQFRQQRCFTFFQSPTLSVFIIFPHFHCPIFNYFLLGNQYNIISIYFDCYFFSYFFQTECNIVRNHLFVIFLLHHF